MQAIETVTITVNGDARVFDAGTPLTSVLRAFGVDPERARGVAVAVNDTLVRRPEWPMRRLAEGDRVEIVTARQGG